MEASADVQNGENLPVEVESAQNDVGSLGKRGEGEVRKDALDPRERKAVALAIDREDHQSGGRTLRFIGHRVMPHGREEKHILLSINPPSINI